MFTGLVEEVGKVERVEPRGNLTRLWCRAQRVLDDAALGDSLAHNGVCLTLAALAPPLYACDVMAETLRVTTLGRLRPGARVNLERAIAAGARFGGHFVQGHVDGVGTVAEIRREDQWITCRVDADEALLGQIVAKGSITVDGISLTVVQALPTGFTVSLIPHTLEVTTLGERRPGDLVNLETDILAKYVQATLSRRPAGGLSFEWLASHGFGSAE